MKPTCPSAAPSRTLHLPARSRDFGEALTAVLLAIAFFLLFARAASAQNISFTWNAGSGAWATPGNWSGGSEYPGYSSSTTDTATIGSVSSGTQIVTLGSNETIATLALNQTMNATNELRLGGGATSTLTVTNALTLGATGGGTSLLYLDGIDNTHGDNFTDSAGATVGSGGVIELGASGVTSPATVAPVLAAPVTINSGGTLDADVATGTSGTTTSVQLNVAGSVTLNGGTLNVGSSNSAGTAQNASSGFDTRLLISGNFLAEGNAAISAKNLSEGTDEIYFAGGISTATFDAGTTGVSTLSGIAYSGTNNGNAFTLSSDVALPAVTLAPTGTTTTSPINVTLESVSGGTLSVASISLTCPTSAEGGKSGYIEFTIGSNISSGDVVVTSGRAYDQVLLNLNGYTLDQSSYAGLFSSGVAGVTYTIEGTGTLKASNFNLASNTVTTSAPVGIGNGTSVSGSGTLLAVGYTGATTADFTSNLGNTAGGTVDAASTFDYTGTAASGAENYLTSNHTIGNLVVGDGTHAATLGTSTAALAVGGGITVNASGVLDLDAESVTESHGGDASAGGLNGSGTVLNGTATTGTVSLGTAILTLDTTDGNGSFSGVLEDHSSGTGVLALVETGTGTQTLSGANTYSGATTINGGTLDFAKAASLYNSTGGGGVSTASAGNVSVASGATLALGVGATTTYFASTDIATVLGHSSFASGAILGLDTTNAASATFTYGSAITNTNSGSNMLGLTKLGTGTLVLSGANTYTGATAVNGGTLALSNTSGQTLSGTTAVTVNSGGTLLFGTGNAVNNSATLTTLTSGTGTATISLQGLNGAKEIMGALTLNAGTTIINFGSGTTVGNTLEFSSLSLSNGAMVDVFNYNANPSDAAYIDNGSLTDAYDRLLFSSSVSSSNLGEINFYSGSSTSSTFLGTGVQIAFAGAGSYQDEVAVPEPSTVFAAVCLLGLIGWRGRRRLQELADRSIVTVQIS